MSKPQIYDKRTLKAGAYLYEEGQKATKAFLILKGAVRISKHIGDQEKEIALLKTGDVVGERALLPDTIHATTARVYDGGAVVITIEEEMLKGKYSETDGLIKTIIKSLVQRLENANKDKFGP